MVLEWIVELGDLWDYSDIIQEINIRGRGVLTHPPWHINLDIIRDFYTKVKPYEDSPFARLSRVKGQVVVFDRDIIHAYLEYKNMVDPKILDSFSIQLARGNYDYD